MARAALPGLLYHTVFSVYHMAAGALTGSWWLLTVGLYYAILSALRFALLLSKKQGEAISALPGGMLMVLSLPLAGTVILTVAQGVGAVLPRILMIAMAAYAFSKITLAIVQLLRCRKSSPPKARALRSVSLADACVSIFALQRSMLVSFGDMSRGKIAVFNALLGAAVCLTVFLLGLELFRRSPQGRG